MPTINRNRCSKGQEKRSKCKKSVSISSSLKNDYNYLEEQEESKNMEFACIEDDELDCDIIQNEVLNTQSVNELSMNEAPKNLQKTRKKEQEVMQQELKCQLPNNEYDCIIMLQEFDGSFSHSSMQTSKIISKYFNCMADSDAAATVMLLLILEK